MPVSAVSAVKSVLRSILPRSLTGARDVVTASDVYRAYRVMSCGRVDAATLRTLNENARLYSWDPHGLMLNLLTLPEVYESLNLPKVAKSIYDHGAMSEVETHFGTKLFGYECDLFVFGNIVRAGGRWEPQVEQTLRSRLRRGDSAIDVGANIGYISAAMCDAVGDAGHVYAFEPMPHLARCVERMAEANSLANLKVHRSAVGSAIGEIALSIDLINAGGNSVAGPREEASARPSRYEPVSCPVVTLDSLLSTFVRPIRFIKIDVEGAEPVVFEGADRLLAEDRPDVVFEFSPPTSRSKGFDPVRAIDRLKALGYRIDPVGREFPESVRNGDGSAVCDFIERRFGWCELLAEGPKRSA